MIALNVGWRVAMNWIQIIVMLSEANNLIANERTAGSDNQRFFAALRMTVRRS
jgi:hypothetical protein